MPFSVVGWSQSVDTGASLTAITGVTDQHVTVTGNDVLVPDFAPNLFGVFTTGVDLTRARMTSPSLRKSLLLDVDEIEVSATPEPGSPVNWFDMVESPITLEPSEALDAEVINDGASASRVDVFAFLRGERVPVPAGRIDTIRATGSTTLTANTWTIVPLTLSQQLEAGTYAIVGMRATSAGAVAARLVIPGSQYRPGVIAGDALTDIDQRLFRRGRLGDNWGQFSHLFVPQVEFFSTSADTTETVHLDIIKVA